MKSLQEIEKEVAALARRVGASLHDLPTYGVSRVSGLWISAYRGRVRLYHYVVVERGEERARRSSADFDDLVYWIFRDVTHGIAFSYELTSRAEDQDCRRIAFPKQIKLMQRLGPKTGERMEQDIAEILRRAPYDDEPTKALNRMRKT
jgi:Immunity protein 63